jgi:hypothetical protein
VDNAKYTDERLRGERECLFCLEGWVFIGSIDNDGEEVIEALKCRKCAGVGVLYGEDER